MVLRETEMKKMILKVSFGTDTTEIVNFFTTKKVKVFSFKSVVKWFTRVRY